MDLDGVTGHQVQNNKVPTSYMNGDFRYLTLFILKSVLFNSLNNPIRYIYDYSHFTDEETKEQKG